MPLAAIKGMARWLSWLEHQPVTLGVVGSSPIRVANAAIAQLVERILGKDEVSSSNLDSSSIKKLLRYSHLGSFCFLHFVLYQIAIFLGNNRLQKA